MPLLSLKWICFIPDRLSDYFIENKLRISGENIDILVQGGQYSVDNLLVSRRFHITGNHKNLLSICTLCTVQTYFFFGIDTYNYSYICSLIRKHIHHLTCEKWCNVIIT